MKSKNKLSKIKILMSDSAWTISALVLLNCVLQFAVYPIWASYYDSESYGNIIFSMSVINILGISVGSATNYARMVESSSQSTCNGNYNSILCAASVPIFLVCIAFLHVTNPQMDIVDLMLAGLLTVLIMWRYYADVEYRLKLKYKGYFIYYLVISIGYGIGILLFWQTKRWQLALIPGEFLGLMLSWIHTSLFRYDTFLHNDRFSQSVKFTCVLAASSFVDSLVFNGDRILLRLALGGTAVTIYYLASLLGKTMGLLSTPINSVLMGHLARYKGSFSKKTFWLVFWGACGLIVFAVLGTFIGSHIIIPILYPDDYPLVKDFFLLANLAQILYFTSGIVITVLLRVAKANLALLINIVYGILFAAICFPVAYWGNFQMFCYALLMINILRFLLALGFCYHFMSHHEVTC